MNGILFLTVFFLKSNNKVKFKVDFSEIILLLQYPLHNL